MSMTEYEMQQVIEKTVKSTLTTVGFDLSDPISIQEDMHFLRSARHLTGAAGTKAVMILIGVGTLAVAGGIFIAIGKAVKQAVTS
ncbi:hypothetical protein KAR91_17205 [Candidatus Pacearchaeota archaeon]|nr:hypothetical protein [Candidatus Pacearchaeota archaeon]